MRSLLDANYSVRFAIFCALLLMGVLANPSGSGQNRPGPGPTRQKASAGAAADVVHIPNRPPAPLFRGEPGKPKTGIRFDPATHMVTIKLLVEDPNSYFIPNLRPDDFVVYENGVRQHTQSVSIEHAPASLALLLEFGGRAQGVSRDLLGTEISNAGKQLLDAVSREDRISIWKYSDQVQKLAEFSSDHDALESVLYKLGTPPFSEPDLYDAVIFMTQQMRPVAGRKAIVVVSSGINTFSKASYDDVLRAVRASDTPLYGIGLERRLRDVASLNRQQAIPPAEWDRAEKRLEDIARESGGRAYTPESTLELAAIYDDILESLKVRYVITYRSSNSLDPDSPRTVRVKLVDSRTGGPLKIVDAKGHLIRASVIVQGSYIPSVASGGQLANRE